MLIPDIHLIIDWLFDFIFNLISRALPPPPPHVNLEDLNAAVHVRQADRNLAVEASGPEEGVVEDVRAVRRGDDDDAGVSLEPFVNSNFFSTVG